MTIGSGRDTRVEDDQLLTHLHEILARSCKGATALTGGAGASLLEAVARRTGRPPTLLPASPPGLRVAGDPGVFRTVVVELSSPNLQDRPLEEILEHAWPRVAADGDLLVCVPNGEARETGESRHAYRQRELKRLLEPYGRPKVLTRQPYRWLVMRVSNSGGTGEPRSRQERFEITADLCRGRVMELGCGRGALVEAVAARGLEVMGVDLSEEKIRAARLRRPDLTFLHGDILDLDPATLGPSFGTVVLAEVLEHVPEEVGDRMLDLARDLLSPGGRLVVTVPNEDCIPHANHVRTFTRRSLERLLKRLGEPILVTRQPYKWLMMYVDLEQGEQSAKSRRHHPE